MSEPVDGWQDQGSDTSVDADEDMLPPIVIEGTSVGVTGFTQDAQGDPFNAHMYISDEDRTATVPLTPQVVQEMLNWLEGVYDAQAAHFGGTPRDYEALLDQDPQPSGGEPADEEKGAEQQRPSLVRRITGLSMVDSAANRLPTAVKIAAGVLVFGLIVITAILIN